MMKPESVRIESEAGAFALFNSVSITNDITGAAAADFELGDDHCEPKIRDLVKHGKLFKVYLDDRIRMTGRVISHRKPHTAQGGSSLHLSIRSRMFDAHYASANPKTRVSDTKLSDFLVELYKPLGYSRSDFVFLASAERDLLTGKSASGGKAPTDFEGIKTKSAKVGVPETIFDAAARHLLRFELAHWETGDGKIYVGAPDDTQSPIYRLQLKRNSDGAGNNMLSADRIVDWSEVPSVVYEFGGGNGKELPRAPFKSAAEWPDVIKAGFYRPVFLQNAALKSQSQSESAARRELKQRSKQKDCFELTVDAWSVFDGHSRVPFGINTTVDIHDDTAGGPMGRFLIYKVSLSDDAHSSKSASLSVVAPGIFKLGA